MNFEEWQVELAAGHTSHGKYHDWLDERIADNRRLTREALEEEQRNRRLLANSLQGWGNGLTTSKVGMSKDKETRPPLHIVDVKSPAPAPAEDQQRNPTTSTDGPLLSGSIPPGAPLLPGTVTAFPQDFSQEGTESDRSDASIGTELWN